MQFTTMNRDERESMSLLLWLLHYGLKNVGKTPHTKFHSDFCYLAIKLVLWIDHQIILQSSNVSQTMDWQKKALEY